MVASGSTSTTACRTGAFSLAVGRDVGHPTGANMLSLVLRNRGRASCVLHGYPRLTLRDASGVLPFAVSHRGDQVVTPRRPFDVVVGPGRSAFVLADKYRCDRGDRRQPARVSVAFPGRSGRALTLALPRSPAPHHERSSVAPLAATTRAG